MENNIQKAIAYSNDNQAEFLATLEEFLKIKTISSDSQFKDEVIKGAQWIVDKLKALGTRDVKMLETSRNPIVYGHLNQAGPDKPTILIYGHYDVQPPDPMDEWESDPFTPVVKNGKLFARGSSDMKGQAMVTFAAIESIQATGEMPVNLKFLLEGDEEVGSPADRSFP